MAKVMTASAGSTHEDDRLLICRISLTAWSSDILVSPMEGQHRNRRLVLL